MSFVSKNLCMSDLDALGFIAIYQDFLNVDLSMNFD
jgi:hypothetical protein